MAIVAVGQAPNASAPPSKEVPALIVHETVATTTAPDGHLRYDLFRSVAVGDRAVATSSLAGAPTASSSSCIADAGIRVKICAWVSYDYYNSGGWKYVSIDTVQNQAYRIDTQASLTKLSWTAYQTGACGVGCSGTVSHQRSGSSTPPASGTRYTMLSGWYGQYQRLSTSPFDVAGDKETLSYTWRGHSLSLSQQLALQ